jgi:alkylation response protein AidB-like acyl-CoA dehydrogenase
MEGTTEFCEVFLDDVRVPVANRVGEENDGWRVANVTLSFERGTAFVADVMQTEEFIRDLADLARHLTSKGATRWEDAGLRRDVGRLAARLDAQWALTKRSITQAQRTGAVGVGGSVFKLAFTELRHELGELAMRVLDRASLSLDDVADVPTGRHMQAYFWALRMSIAAGTSQVQRNIVGERVLGLPRER